MVAFMFVEHMRMKQLEYDKYVISSLRVCGGSSAMQCNDTQRPLTGLLLARCRMNRFVKRFA
jgi:hypothetical protein